MHLFFLATNDDQYKEHCDVTPVIIKRSRAKDHYDADDEVSEG